MFWHLMVTDDKSRIRIIKSEVLICGSGSAPKCHGPRNTARALCSTPGSRSNVFYLTNTVVTVQDRCPFILVNCCS